MIDSVIAGTGDSRYLRSSVAAGTTWDDVLTMLRAGTFPIDLAGINANGFATLGTALNAANLLASATATALGLDSGATPDDALNALIALLADKLDADQGSANANKIMGVDSNGDVQYVSVDAAPTEDSDNLISSGAVYDATADKVDAAGAAAAAPVQSVAGKTGTVTLDADDVAYDPTDTYSAGTVGKAIADANEDIVNAYPKNIASGAVANFADGTDGLPVVSLVASIAPVQSGSGDPAPDNVRPISGWSTIHVYHSGADTSDYDTVTVTIPATPGTVYGGTLDIISGVLTVDRQLATVPGTVEGADNWTMYAAGKFYSANNTLPNGAAYGDDVASIYISNLYPFAGNGNSGSSVITSDKHFYGQTGYRRFWVYDSTYSTLAAFEAAMDTTPLTAVYPIATPLTYQLTPEELTTLLGENNIWADSGNTAVTYRADPTLYIPKTAADVGAVAVAQGVAHAGEFCVVGSDGNITTVTMTAWQGGNY